MGHILSQLPDFVLDFDEEWLVVVVSLNWRGATGFNEGKYKSGQKQ